jgi:stearoyl-CoA desaturase (delta-9 desaturase)
MTQETKSKKNEVHWRNTIFMTTTLAGTLVGLPLFLWHYGNQVTLWAYAVLFVGMFIFSGLSITLGYHRLFAHMAFKAKWPVRLATLIGGATALEDSALHWCSDHRRHHKFVDHDEDDPYSISRGFFHAHIGWILYKEKVYPPLDNVKDLMKDPMVVWQHKYWLQIGVILGFGLPALIGYFIDGGLGAVAGLLIGGMARLVGVQHCTFFINSLCHCIGKQPYSSDHTARDSWIMALFTFGEGYHNYHHEFQYDYRNGVKAWQFDPTKWTVWVLSKLSMVQDLRRVPKEKIMLAEIKQKQKLLLEKLAKGTLPVCEKARALFSDAGRKLTDAARTWESAKHEYGRALKKQLDLTVEQVDEIHARFDQAVADLRAAIQEWNDAHMKLEGQLA